MAIVASHGDYSYERARIVSWNEVVAGKASMPVVARGKEGNLAVSLQSLNVNYCVLRCI